MFLDYRLGICFTGTLVDVLQSNVKMRRVVSAVRRVNKMLDKLDEMLVIFSNAYERYIIFEYSTFSNVNVSIDVRYDCCCKWGMVKFTICRC